MSVKLRLRRMGSKKRPIYRLVAIDSRRARNGRFVEQLGHYNPIEKPATFTVDEDRVYEWLKRGAIPSDTVRNLFGHIGLNEKWQKIREGKDASDIELKSTITERKKRTRKVKAAAAKAAEEEEKAREEKAKGEEPRAEEPKAEEPKADEPKAEEPVKESKEQPAADQAEQTAEEDKKETSE